MKSAAKRYCKTNFDFWFVGLFVVINPRPQSYFAYSEGFIVEKLSHPFEAMWLVQTDNTGQKKVYLEILRPEIDFQPNQENLIITQPPFQWSHFLYKQFYPFCQKASS